MKKLLEDWRKCVNEEEHLNEELLDEGLRDWLKSKSAAAIAGIKDGLKKIGQEIKESGEAGKLIMKAATGQKLSDKELAFVKRQLQDIGVGTALLAIFFLPGGALGVGAIVKLGKYFGIDILPTAFQESLMNEKWSDSERKKRKDKCANPKGFTMKQFCKNQKSRSKKGERKN